MASGKSCPSASPSLSRTSLALRGRSATRELLGLPWHQAPSPFPTSTVVGGQAHGEEGGSRSYPPRRLSPRVLYAGPAVLSQAELPARGVLPTGWPPLQGSCPRRGAALCGAQSLPHLPSKCSCALAPRQSRPALTALWGTHLFGQLQPPTVPANLPSPDLLWEAKPVFPTSLTGLFP